MLAVPTSVSLEQLNLEADSPVKQDECKRNTCSQQDSKTPVQSCHEPSEAARNCNQNVRMPYSNGQAYSVSQNKVVYLPASVKHRVNELELQSTHTNGASSRKISLDRKGLVLNLTNQFETSSSKPGSPTTTEDELLEEEEQTAQAQTKLAPQMLTAVLVKKEIWDPGEKESPTVYAVEQVSQPSVPSDSDRLVWSAPEDVMYVSELKLGEPDSAKVSAMLPKREGDPFSAQLDRVFEREERKQQRTTIPATPLPPPVLPPCVTELSNEAPNRECPSRQSSWSSYDSAVVLGFQGEARDAPSRQSSWGSGDTRWTYGGGGTLPSRNSSWGSYDMRPPMQYVNERGEKQQIQTNLDELLVTGSSGMFPYDRDEIPWYPGTVKRTKQKLEEGTSTVKRVCSDSQQRSESPSSPPAGSQGDSAPGVNVKIHGPRPYRSPSSDRLLPNTGFSFPSSDPHTSDLHSEDQSHIMVHYASSPTLCSHHSVGHESDDSMSTSPGSADKMASSQPNITFMNSERRTNYDREASVPAIRTLSVSAPTTSSMSLVEGIEPLTPPSQSLPSVSSACLSSEPVDEASPCIISTTQCESVMQQKRALESLTTRRCISVDSSVESSDSQKSVSGLVKILKEEFEAKSVSKSEKGGVTSEAPVNESDQRRSSDGGKTRSLPSSPVSTHPEVKSPNSPTTTADDFSVKFLVGKYEVNKPESPPLAGKQTENTSRKTLQQPPVPSRKSSLEILQNNSNKHSSLLVRNLHNGNEGPNSRPPMAPHVRGPSPSVVVASVVAKAASKKQQQGKTHPLACLPRHTNTVYNTM